MGNDEGVLGGGIGIGIDRGLDIAVHWTGEFVGSMYLTGDTAGMGVTMVKAGVTCICGLTIVVKAGVTRIGIGGAETSLRARGRAQQQNISKAIITMKTTPPTAAPAIIVMEIVAVAATGAPPKGGANEGEIEGDCDVVGVNEGVREGDAVNVFVVDGDAVSVLVEERDCDKVVVGETDGVSDIVGVFDGA